MRKLKHLGLTNKLYARYVDDVLAALNVINKGRNYDKIKNEMVFSKEKENEDTRSGMHRTAEILVEIANSLDRNIQLPGTFLRETITDGCLF